MEKGSGSVVQRVWGRGKRLKRGVKRRLHLFAPPQVVPFRGHGTPGRVFLSGRVLERTGVVSADAKPGGLWKALGRSFRRFESDEIPGAQLQVVLGTLSVPVRTDEEGYFHVELAPEPPLAPGWHPFEVHLLASLAGGAGAMGRSELLVPPPDAAFGIISDVDDTVVATRAAHKLERTRIILLNDAHQRTPFPGVAALYGALTRGPQAQGANPLYFLSRSPWNLYDLFHRFFALHGIPRAPLFLEDSSLLEPPSSALGGHLPKQERIRRLLELYPRLPFVLMGDSGQQDPEVYRDVVRRFPGRIRAVLIRDVSSKAKRDREVEAIVQEVRALGVPMVRAGDSVALAEHAARCGLVAPGAVQQVREACERTSREPRAS